MKSDIYLIASLPQWAIFLGIISFFWGLIEKKAKYCKIGSILFATTGIIAGISLLIGDFGTITTPTETGAILKVLCLSAILLGLVSVIHLNIQWKKSKNNTWLTIFTILLALTNFFMYYNVLHGIFEK
ncbi:hypothetical protein K4L44_11440 [Halosquirtibacter laminarini]|uniref:Uncharacterized protein n=1 Tax=Halosquirtibacter laminarini TaxID=3374600 RepID=A0AC61NCI7_9BACT|nr:hypothetical protein K4L44_11440 [Prolixibacteraceae bacterium]